MFTADLETVQHQVSNEQSFPMQKYGMVIEQDPATWGTEDGSPCCLERTFPHKTFHVSEQKNEGKKKINPHNAIFRI